MKQVILFAPKIPEIVLKDASPAKIYVAISKEDKSDKWILCCEQIPDSIPFPEREYGWIFRYWDNPCGMAGWNKTIYDAIKYALTVNNGQIEVFEFETHKEAAEFLLQKTP